MKIRALGILLFLFFVSCGGDNSGGGSSSTASSSSIIGGTLTSNRTTVLGDMFMDIAKLTDPAYDPKDNSSQVSIVDVTDPNSGGVTNPGPSTQNQNTPIPLESFSACAMTIDGVVKTDGTIENGKKLENLFINIKTNHVSPEIFAHWRDLGWLDSSEGVYTVPIILSGKITYTKDILGSTPITEDIFFPTGFAPAVNNLPDKANTFLVFVEEGNRYGYSRIPPQIGSFIESGTFAIFSQQLWRSAQEKENKAESFAGADPQISELTVQIPLRKDEQGVWHYETVIVKNLSVNRVVWGTEPLKYSPQNGCYDGISAVSYDVLSLKRPNFETKDMKVNGTAWWSHLQWEVAP